MVIVGEIRNNSVKPKGLVRIGATLLDSTGKTTDTEFTYAMLRIIPSGDKAPFWLMIGQQYSEIGNYELYIADVWPTELGRQDLVVTNHSYNKNTQGYIPFKY